MVCMPFWFSWCSLVIPSKTFVLKLFGFSPCLVWLRFFCKDPCAIRGIDIAAAVASGANQKAELFAPAHFGGPGERYGTLCTVQKSKSGGPPRALADSVYALLLAPLDDFSHLRTGEAAALHLRKVIAGDALQLADRTAECIEIVFAKGGQRAQQHESAQMRG